MPISPQNARYIYAPSTDAAFWFLLTVWTPGDPEIRLVNNLEPVVSRGLTFEPYPFSLVLPNDDSTKTPTVTITIDNVDRRLVELIRGLPTAPNVKVELITSKFPDLVEREIDYLKVRNVEYNAMSIQFTLEIQNVMARQFPAGSYDPVQFSDLFYVFPLALFLAERLFA
jgi:hypothetical protein